MTGLDHAILGLRQALDTPRRHRMWRWLVRHRMAAVKEALTAESGRGIDGWLAAREIGLHREASQLLNRLTDLGPKVLEAPNVEPVRGELHRLLLDLERHRQHVNDLVYDSVLLELGGSD